MADKKISALTGASTPLAGTEVLPIVQGGTTVKVSAADITAGRNVSMANATVGSGGSGAVSTGIVLEGSSNAAYGAFIQGKRGGSGAWLTGDYSSAFGSGDGYLVFGYSTNPIVFHSQSNGELLRLTSTNVQVTSGNLVIGTAGKGIDFSAATHAAGMTSELLNDYEEGTYTVAIGCGTSGTVTLNTAYDTAQYTKVGRLVTVTGGVIVSSVLLPLGYFTISLPFTSASLSELSGYFLSVLTISGVNTANIADFVSLGVNGASSIRVYLGDATGLQGDSAQELKAGTEIYFTISYIAA